MKQTNLEFQGVSQNLKYIFTNRGIIPTGDYFNTTNNNILEYSFENLPIAVQILKEHKELFYKSNKISLTEYVNSSRKFLYELMEIFQPSNQITVIKEWENTFGNKLLLINESVDNLIIERRVNESWASIQAMIVEAWYNPVSWDWKGGVEKAGKWIGDQAKAVKDWTVDQAKQIKDKGVLKYLGDKAKSVYNSVKNAVVKAWNCLTNNFVECLMEGLRSAAFSAVGMGVMTAVTFIPGVGQVADAIVFGSLLIWDIYKALSGKYESGQYQWSFADIIIDAVCILLPALGPVLRGALRGIKGAGQLAVAAAKKGGVLAKAVNLLKGGLSKIVSVIGKAATWIGEKLGITWLKNFGSKATNFMTKTTQELGGAAVKNVEIATAKSAKDPLLKRAVGGVETKLKTAKKGTSQFLKDFKFTKPTPVVVKKTGVTIMLTGALCAAMGLDGWTCHHKVENGEITQEQLNQAMAEMNSEKTGQSLSQLSDDEINKLGLF